MRYRETERRLAELEAVEQARSGRVRLRVVEHLSADDLAGFKAYLERWEVNPAAVPSPTELAILYRVDALVQADPEARPCDMLGLPPLVTGAGDAT